MLVEIAAYNASGDMLYLNGADTDSAMTKTVEGYRVALRAAVEGPKTAPRWHDGDSEFRRNKIAKFRFRADNGAVEIYTRDEAAAELARLDAMLTPKTEETAEVTTVAAKARKTKVVHPDGTTSTRSSATKVYTWAVEVKHNAHAEALDLEDVWASAVENRKAFEEAANARTVEKAGSVVSATYYLRHDALDLRWYLGGYSPARDAKPFDVDAGIEYARRQVNDSVDRMAASLDKLWSGPEIVYSVVRWSERADAANAAVGSFKGRHDTYRVVKCEEV